MHFFSFLGYRILPLLNCEEKLLFIVQNFALTWRGTVWMNIFGREKPEICEGSLSDYGIPKVWRDDLSVLKFPKEVGLDTYAARGCKVLSGKSLTWLHNLTRQFCQTKNIKTGNLWPNM